MSRHRAPVRPRYGRITALAASTAVTAVAVLGSTGVLPVTEEGASATTATDPAAAVATERGIEPGRGSAARVSSSTDGPRADLEADLGAGAGADDADPVVALPSGSGTGRRVVFSESRQRVWLVDGSGAGTVERTYPVSGSVYDNLDPGTYAVYSRSEQAYGIDDSGTMRWFVRFTEGENAAIGFHDIPIDDGRPVQGPEDLGTPTSHGCIRQRAADARALWDFAPIGTPVVVTA